MRVPVALLYDTDSGELVVLVHDPTLDEDIEVARWAADRGAAAGLVDRAKAQYERAEGSSE